MIGKNFDELFEIGRFLNSVPHTCGIYPSVDLSKKRKVYTVYKFGVLDSRNVWNNVE